MVTLHLQTQAYCCVAMVPKNTQEMSSLIQLLLVMALALMEQF